MPSKDALLNLRMVDLRNMIDLQKKIRRLKIRNFLICIIDRTACLVLAILISYLKDTTPTIIIIGLSIIFIWMIGLTLLIEMHLKESLADYKIEYELIKADEQNKKGLAD